MDMGINKKRLGLQRQFDHKLLEAIKHTYKDRLNRE